MKEFIEIVLAISIAGGAFALMVILLAVAFNMLDDALNNLLTDMIDDAIDNMRNKDKGK